MSDSTTGTKTCPDCGEQVLAVAVVCKHCGFRERLKKEHSIEWERQVPWTLAVVILLVVVVSLFALINLAG